MRLDRELIKQLALKQDWRGIVKILLEKEFPEYDWERILSSNRILSKSKKIAYNVFEAVELINERYSNDIREIIRKLSSLEKILINENNIIALPFEYDPNKYKIYCRARYFVPFIVPAFLAETERPIEVNLNLSDSSRLWLRGHSPSEDSREIFIPLALYIPFSDKMRLVRIKITTIDKGSIFLNLIKYSNLRSFTYTTSTELTIIPYDGYHLKTRLGDLLFYFGLLAIMNEFWELETYRKNGSPEFIGNSVRDNIEIMLLKGDNNEPELYVKLNKEKYLSRKEFYELRVYYLFRNPYKSPIKKIHINTPFIEQHLNFENFRKKRKNYEIKFVSLSSLSPTEYLQYSETVEFKNRMINMWIKEKIPKIADSKLFPFIRIYRDSENMSIKGKNMMITITMNSPNCRLEIIGESGENYLVLPSILMVKKISLEGMKLYIPIPHDKIYPFLKILEENINIPTQKLEEAIKKGIIWNFSLEIPSNLIPDNIESIFKEWENVIKSGKYTLYQALIYKILEYLVYKKKHRDILEDSDEII